MCSFARRFTAGFSGRSRRPKSESPVRISESSSAGSRAENRKTSTISEHSGVVRGVARLLNGSPAFLVAEAFYSEARVLKFDRTIVALNLVVTVGLSTLLGCDSTPNGNNGGASDGRRRVDSLVLQGGTTVNTFAYSITGPGTYSGSINVASSSAVSSVIGNIAAGTGYALTLTGTSVDGKTSCSGTSTSFSVGRRPPRPPWAWRSTATPLRRPAASCRVNGAINVCPRIARGQLRSADGERARDIRAPPSGQRSAASHYSWTTTSGTLSSATAQNPTLTCTGRERCP